MTHPQLPSATSTASSTIVPLLEKDHHPGAGSSARLFMTVAGDATTEVEGRDVQAEARAHADRRIEDNCSKAMGKREDAAEKRRQHKTREEEAKQTKAERQAAKQAEAAAKKQKKAEQKKEEEQRKVDKKAEKARDLTRKQYLGGIAWGYDPRAGVADCLPADVRTSRYRSGGRDSDSRRTPGRSDSAGSGPHYYDRVTGKYYPQSEFGSNWGIEIGGPNRATPPGLHSDRFAKAMAEVDKTSRGDGGGLSRDPGASQEALADGKGKGKFDAELL